MKKITLLAFLFIFSLNNYAQLTEGFEGATFPPTGWARFRGTNGIGTAQDWGISTTAANVAAGTQGAFVLYENVTGGLAEDWLVTPQFTVTAPNTILSFYDRQQYTINYNTNYYVKVSTTSQTDIASFVTVDTKTEADLPFTMTQRSVDLSAYVGQQIYVAFVMVQDDGDNWALDQISMMSSVTPPGCATLVSPADSSTSVPVGNVNFSWNAPTTGDAPTGYKLYVGTTNPPTTLIGTYTSTTASAVAANYNTTYYWMVVPVNLGGEATGCSAYSFTTEPVQPYCLYAANGQFPSATFTPATCNGATLNQITTCGYAGEYSVVNVVSGETYTFVSSEASDIITISTDNGTSAAVYGTGSVTWVSTLTGTVRFYTHIANCGAESACRIRSVICGPPPTTAPDCPTLVAPADAATNQNLSVPISWTAPTTGSPLTEYYVYLDVSNPPVAFIGSTTNTSATLTGLDPATTYYWMVNASNAAGESASCVVYSFTTASTPSNDNCSNPIALTPGGVFTDNDIDSTNSAATLSAETPVPTCGASNFTTSGRDVWYSVVVPPSGSITIETGVTAAGGTGMDTVIAVYSGTCSALTQAGCDDDGASETTYGLSKLSLTGQTPGATLLIRLFGYDGQEGSYSISAYDASLGNNTFDNSSFRYYPNPVKDILYLTYSKNIEKIQVINLLGQEVIAKSIDSTESQIDMSQFTSGTYFVKVTSDSQTQTIKVIKE